MTATHRRHDLSNQVWERLQPHLPGEAGKVLAAGSGQPPLSERGVLDSAHRGPMAGPAAGLRGLEEYAITALAAGGTGVYGPHLLDGVIDDPDFQWLMIDAS